MKTTYAGVLRGTIGASVALLLFLAAGTAGCSASDKHHLKAGTNKATRNAGHPADAVNAVSNATDSGSNTDSNADSNVGSSNAGNAGNSTPTNTGTSNQPATNSNAGTATNSGGNTPPANASATNSNTAAGNSNAAPAANDPAANEPAANNAGGPSLIDPGHTEACPLPPQPDSRRMTGMEVGQELPELIVPELFESGKSVDLSSLKGNGRWVVLEFWASWCQVCKAQAEEFMRPLYEAHGKGPDRRLDIISIGLSINDTAAKQQAEVRTHKHDWMHLFDEGDQCKEAFGIKATPAVIVIDPDGKVVTFGRLQNTTDPPNPWANDLKAFLESSCLDKAPGNGN